VQALLVCKSMKECQAGDHVVTQWLHVALVAYYDTFNQLNELRSAQLTYVTLVRLHPEPAQHTLRPYTKFLQDSF
jgi:hypothetical protein